MYTPTEKENFEEDTTMGDALHSIIIGRHRYSFVTKDSGIVGILRLVDVFKLLCEKVKECKI